MSRIIFFVILIFPFSHTYLQTLKKGEDVFVIHPNLKECSGEVTVPCYQAKKLEDKHWNIYIEHIEGFEFEEGNQYTLKLAVTHNDMPLRDMPSITYKLIKVISKEKIIPDAG
ncbi:MAG: DUF4377 domain-containing protein [Crocinitomicaceae bacterium]|nr:DUF4377 domain-containing protein [Crocinitomicaceae bacterium]